VGKIEEPSPCAKVSGLDNGVGKGVRKAAISSVSSGGVGERARQIPRCSRAKKSKVRRKRNLKEEK